MVVCVACVCVDLWACVCVCEFVGVWNVWNLLPPPRNVLGEARGGCIECGDRYENLGEMLLLLW